MHIAIVADELTSACLAAEARTYTVTPLNYRWVLRLRRPDLLFVESAWEGHREAWKFKIAAYPDYPQRNNRKLAQIVAYARDLGIPTVFWNKEDGVHFDRFIDSAVLFDHIFTVDETCIPRYRERVPDHVTVHALPFAVQPTIHAFNGFHFRHNRANFVGSYSQHIHPRRREWQQMLFTTACQTGLGLSVYDRNSARKSENYRYPSLPGMTVHQAVMHRETARIYKENLVSINVNTIEDSPSMYSRRLVEILACGGIAVTNPSPAVDRYFHDFCHVVQDADQAAELFARLRHGPSSEDLQRAEAGAQYIASLHTWSTRLQAVAEIIGGL